MNKTVKILAFLLIGVFLYSYELFYAREKAVIFGIPKHQNSFIDFTTRVFRNEGFILGYSEIRANPLWVMYKIQNQPKNPKKLPRPSHFSSDIRSIRFISHDDYTKSGYDRGHMAPNFAMSALYGKEAQKDSFLMSNITPQKPNLNQKLWQALEIKEYDEYARDFDEMWVITGAIFDEKVEYLKSSKVEIADSFYKIFLGKKGESFYTLSYLIPHNVKGYEKLEKFVTSIDEIEKLSGFNFFPKMQTELQNALEAKESLTFRE